MGTEAKKQGAEFVEHLRGYLERDALIKERAGHLATVEQVWERGDQLARALADAADEIERLAGWQAEALEVLARWDTVAGLVPDRVTDIGRSKADIVAEVVASAQEPVRRDHCLNCGVPTVELRDGTMWHEVLAGSPGGGFRRYKECHYARQARIAGVEPPSVSDRAFNRRDGV